MIDKLLRVVVRFRHDESGQTLTIAAIFVMVLMMTLGVVLNLSFAVQDKIRAQNAADAAALTGGIMQVRGLAFVQNMNNAMFVCDMGSFVALNVAAVMGPCTAIPVAGMGVLAVGNVALGTSVALNVVSIAVITPIRDIMANAWGVVCYMGASAMAGHNNVSSITGSFRYGTRLGAELLDRKAEDLGMNGEVFAGGLYGSNDLKEDMGGQSRSGGETDFDIWSLLENIELYTVGLECSFKRKDEEAKEFVADDVALEDIEADNIVSIKDQLGFWPICLHLDRLKADGGSASMAIPWQINDRVINTLLHLATPLTPASSFAHSYYTAVSGRIVGATDKLFDAVAAGVQGGDTPLPSDEAKADEANNTKAAFGDMAPKAGANYWNHSFYESQVEKMDEDVVTLPESTWFVYNGPKSGTDLDRGIFWEGMGGLGVYAPDSSSSSYEDFKGRRFGALGAMAVASVRVTANRVRKEFYNNMSGWVQMVPVKLTKDPDSRSLGICH